MKSNDNETRVYAEFENRVDIVFSPEITKYNISNIDENRILAELVSYLRSFYILIDEIRKVSDIKVVSYPKNTDLDKLIQLIYPGFEIEKSKIIEEGVTKILDKYNLSEYWNLSIRTAIITHTLLIPPKYGNIRFHFPLEKQYKEKIPKKLSEISENLNSHMDRARKMTETAFYPAIYFTEQTTIKEIKTWLEKNKSWFRQELSKLKKPIKSKMKYTTLFWGQVAWILIQDGIKNWTEISRKAEDLVNESCSEDNFMEVPGEVEFRNSYLAFLDKLNELENK